MVIELHAPGPLPLYARVASILRERIRGGEWQPGTQIPTIDELRGTYQVAEITLRQAIRTLSDEGLLLSRRGKGTFVLDQLPLVHEKTVIDTVLEQFSALDPTHRIKILKRERDVGAPMWDWNPGRPASRYTHITKLHIDRSGEPYALFHMHIESTIYKRLPARADESDKIIRLIQNHGGVKLKSGRERLTIGVADFSEAERLACPADLPVARIKRVFLDRRGVVLLFGAITYRGDRLIIERDFTNLFSLHKPG
jgi:GntR family transcriptional regulator